jgi:hypothetical protein
LRLIGAAGAHAAAARPSSVMKSRRFTALYLRAPNKRNSIQGTAALRDFELVNVADGSWLCENSSARRARRNISKKLRTMESNRTARTMFDTLPENCIFYISPMYEFSHGLGQSATSRFVRAESVLASTPDIGEPDRHVSVVPIGDIQTSSTIDRVNAASCRISGSS